MSQSGISARHLLDVLEELGIDHVIWLPDSESAFLYQALQERPHLRLVPVTREGEAVPIAAGLLAGGRRPVVIMQSTGFYESADSLRGIAIDCRLPILLLIGYRGYSPEGTSADSAAQYLEPVLRAWQVPYCVVTGGQPLENVRRALRDAEERRGPVAVLIAEEYVA